MEDDIIFKALADSNRRHILDLLFQKDGQTLGELCEHFVQMTRYGVMKHLQVLEEADLIATHKRGREKYHYLNPVPIQQVYNRWVSKYSQTWSQSLTYLKYALESETDMNKPKHKMQIFIRTTPDKLWDALINGKITPQYYVLNARVQSSWENGALYQYIAPDGQVMIDGYVEEFSPYNKLVMTFNALWIPEPDRGDTTRVIFEIEPVGMTCKLTLTHEGLADETPLRLGIETGWSQILSSLKSLLETGQSLGLDSM